MSTIVVIDGGRGFGFQKTTNPIRSNYLLINNSVPIRSFSTHWKPQPFLKLLNENWKLESFWEKTNTY